MTAIIIQVYVCALAASVIAFIGAMIMSYRVSYQPDLSDVSKRKGIFWLYSILAPVLTALLTFFIVYLGLKTGSKKSVCILNGCIGLVVSWGIYVILGLVVSKANKQGKLGSWF